MKRIVRIWLPLLLSGIFISCIDDKYDLDNIDMTIGTSGDLKVPTSSTGEIILKNIMEEDGIVQVVDGEYFLIEGGEADVPKITIEPISIKKPELNGFEADVTVNDIAQGLPKRKSTSAFPGIDDRRYEYTIRQDDETHYDINVFSDAITEKVISLDTVLFAKDKKPTLDARIKIIFDEDHSFINKVHLDYLTVTLPKGLHVSHAEFGHCTQEDGKDTPTHAKSEVVNSENIDNENGIIRFTEKDKNTIVGEGHEVHVRITFDKAVTGTEGFTFADNKIFLTGNFRIDATFRLETSDFDLTALSDDQKQQIIQNGFDAIRPEKIKFVGNASFDNDIAVESFAGEIEVGEISPIVLDNLPDFLNDPEVCLDLKNPAFFVVVKNEIPAKAKTKITLMSVYKDGTSPVTKEAEPELEIPASDDVLFCLATDPEKAITPMDEDYTNLRRIDVRIDDLGELLRKLPKEINVDLAEMKVDNMPIPTKEPAKEYNVGVKYKIYTPLEYGNKTKLVYQGTEEGLSEDLADVNTLDTKEVRIDAKAVTNFPMDLTLSVDALDKNNVSMIDKIVKVVYDNDDKKKSILINAHNGKDFSVQPISLTIKPVKGHSISEMLQKLDKFHYRAVAEAVGEGKLMENVSIKLTDINITLKGGISYDAN